MRFRDAAFMGIMRWAFYRRLREKYEDVHLTYGYQTKDVRIAHHLEKTYTTDAYCIAENMQAKRTDTEYLRKQVRRHNRKIHREVPAKGNIRRRAQAGHLVKGFALNDIVRAKGALWFIAGRRTKGSFVLKHLDGKKLEIVPFKIQFVAHNHSYLVERREVAFPSAL